MNKKTGNKNVKKSPSKPIQPVKPRHLPQKFAMRSHCLMLDVEELIAPTFTARPRNYLG